MKTEVPLTLDGASVLHQMFRIRWQAWKGLSEERRREVARRGRRCALRNGAVAERAVLAAGPQGRSDADALPQLASTS